MLECEVFLNLRVVTPLFPNTFQQKAVSEQLNQDLGLHVDDFKELFSKLNIMSFKKEIEQEVNQKRSTEDLLENLELKQEGLITDELTDRAMRQLRLESFTDYELLLHQKQGLIWMLEREKFYEHNSSNESIALSGFATKNLKGFLNPLWEEYCVAKDLRCPTKIRPKLDHKIYECNERNLALDDQNSG